MMGMLSAGSAHTMVEIPENRILVELPSLGRVKMEMYTLWKKDL